MPFRIFLACIMVQLISTKLSECNDEFMQEVSKKIEAENYKINEIDGNITGMNKIDGTDWILVSYIPKDIIYSDVNHLREALIVISIISIILKKPISADDWRKVTTSVDNEIREKYRVN